MNPEFKNLYGRQCIFFRLKLSSLTGLSTCKLTRTIDEPKSNVRPTLDCDIIIDGSSTYSHRIAAINPDFVIMNTMTDTFSGGLTVGLHGYAMDESEFEDIKTQFLKLAKFQSIAYIEKSLNEIECLRGVDYA
jgi:hypothetical protein